MGMTHMSVEPFQAFKGGTIWGGVVSRRYDIIVTPLAVQYLVVLQVLDHHGEVVRGGVVANIFDGVKERDIVADISLLPAASDMVHLLFYFICNLIFKSNTF